MVGYWRKFNALHQFIVDKYNNGEDDCNDICISTDDCKEILSVLEQIQEDNSRASTLMLTASGFFFGGTDYDQYYFKDIDYSIELFKEVIQVVEAAENEKRFYDIIYRASW